MADITPASSSPLQQYLRADNLLVADNDQNSPKNNFESKSTSTSDVTHGKSRKECILNSSDCLFIVNKNPNASAQAPLYELEVFSQVKQYEQTIEQTAKEAGVDPDLVKAIIHMETTHGYYDIPLSAIDANKSILPMNINTDYWGSSFGTREQLNVPSTNIKEGTRMIKSIQNNLPDNASIAEIATVYNNLNANKISDYGARVEAIYNSKAWEQ